VLMYHKIDDSAHVSKLSVTPESFRKQMSFLKRHKFNVVSLEELVSIVGQGKRPPRKTVAITFDDGYDNNYTNAFPVLKEFSLPATIFVVPNYIGREGYLSSDEIREMSREGIDIGSHSMRHAWLPKLEGAELRQEVSGSKAKLEKITGSAVNFLSYPLGGFNKKVRQGAIDAGYLGACATNPGKDYPDNDVYAIKRVRISRTSDNPIVFWIESSGYYTFIKEVRDED